MHTSVGGADVAQRLQHPALEQQLESRLLRFWRSSLLVRPGGPLPLARETHTGLLAPGPGSWLRPGCLESEPADRRSLSLCLSLSLSLCLSNTEFICFLKKFMGKWDEDIWVRKPVGPMPSVFTSCIFGELFICRLEPGTVSAPNESQVLT